ncbi:MAG: acetylornithine deacetylase [Pikeienuella sp.]
MSVHYSVEEMLARLVGFPTVSSDSNLELIHFVRDYLAGHGVDSRLVPNEDGTKANLYAQIGPDQPGGVILSGHTDVVPVEGQPWSTDPFTLTEKDGRLYGRGAADMKGFEACVLAAVPQMLDAGLKRPIQIALSYDEEVGCLGAPFMIKEMRETLPPASAVIVGEPTMMEVVSRHKGVIRIITDVRGHEVHSAQIHRGVAATMVAARLTVWAEDQMVAAKARAEAEPDPVAGLFEPPYTTWHVGQINGGTAPNITAKDCRFWLDIRNMPGEDQGALITAYEAEVARQLAEMRQVRAETDIRVTLHSQTPGCRKEPDQTAEAERLARSLTGDNGEHVVAYGTEAGQFQDAGYSAIICGPGDIAQAHQADEFIARSQLTEGARFVSRLIDRLAA